MNKEVTPFMRVCSLHFTRENYIFPDAPAVLRCLKTNAAPSCNLPVSSNTAKVINTRARQLKIPKQSHRLNSTSENQDQIVISKKGHNIRMTQSESSLEPGIQATNGDANLSGYFSAAVTSNSDLRAIGKFCENCVVI